MRHRSSVVRIPVLIGTTMGRVTDVMPIAATAMATADSMRSPRATTTIPMTAAVTSGVGFRRRSGCAGVTSGFVTKTSLRQPGASATNTAGALCSTEAAAVVRHGEIDQRADRHDAGRIDLTLAAVIVPLDLIDADGLGNAGHGIKIAQIIPQVGIVGDAAQIALEMAVIDGVETDERGEQPPVRFGDLTADQITLPRQALFELIESDENGAGGFFVGCLAGGKAGAIDAVIDVRIDEVVDAIDFGAQFRGIVIGAHIGERIEGGIEHADDFGGFVVDDGTALLVPQHRNRHAAGIMRIGEKIDFSKRRLAVDLVARAALGGAEFPA